MSTNIVTKSESLATQSAPRVSPEPEVLLTAPEVAERLRVPLSWVRKHGKELPGLVRLGKYVRWSATELDRFIAGGGLP